MVAVFFTSLAATALGTMSGGGIEIIMYPVFISFGIPVPLIISTAFTTNIFWALPAAYNYLKGRVVDWTFVALFSAIGLVGCFLGISALLAVQPRVYQISIGVIILFFVAYLYLNKDLGLNEKREYSKTRGIFAYPFALLMGFYEVILGAGNAIALSILTFYTRGFDLIDALVHPSPELRLGASEELKRITKEYFGYYYNLPKRDRERASEKKQEEVEALVSRPGYGELDLKSKPVIRPSSSCSS